MAITDSIFISVENQSKVLAGELFQKYTQQALSDTQDYLHSARADLETWCTALKQNQLSKNEFESLVRGQKDLAKMNALKAAGLAQVSLDTFTTGVMNIVINAAFAALKV